MNAWTVPMHGNCCFSYCLSPLHCLGNDGRVTGNPEELYTLLRESRIRVSALQYPVVRSMFASLITLTQRKLFVNACSKDLLFNHEQVSQLCRDQPEVAPAIVGALFPCVLGKSSQLMLLSCLDHQWVGGLSLEVANSLWFQP